LLTTGSLSEVTEKQNTDVLVEATIIEADKRHEDYIRMYEKDDKKSAIENITKLEKELLSKNEVFSDIVIGKKKLKI